MTIYLFLLCLPTFLPKHSWELRDSPSGLATTSHTCVFPAHRQHILKCQAFACLPFQGQLDTWSSAKQGWLSVPCLTWSCLTQAGEEDWPEEQLISQNRSHFLFLAKRLFFLRLRMPGGNRLFCWSFSHHWIRLCQRCYDRGLSAVQRGVCDLCNFNTINPYGDFSVLFAISLPIPGQHPVRFWVITHL